jgi:hypothetical protein
LLGGSARAGERRPRLRAAFGLLASGEVFGRDKERRFRARVSNLPYCAATGVKAQAFVRVLFSTGLPREQIGQQ